MFSSYVYPASHPFEGGVLAILGGVSMNPQKRRGPWWQTAGEGPRRSGMMKTLAIGGSSSPARSHVSSTDVCRALMTISLLLLSLISSLLLLLLLLFLCQLFIIINIISMAMMMTMTKSFLIGSHLSFQPTGAGENPGKTAGTVEVRMIPLRRRSSGGLLAPPTPKIITTRMNSVME